jgi:hypothetical protein
MKPKASPPGLGEGRNEVRNSLNAPRLLCLSCPLLLFRYIYSNTKLYILNLRCEIDIQAEPPASLIPLVRDTSQIPMENILGGRKLFFLDLQYLIPSLWGFGLD